MMSRYQAGVMFVQWILHNGNTPGYERYSNLKHLNHHDSVSQTINCGDHALVIELSVRKVDYEQKED